MKSTPLVGLLAVIPMLLLGVSPVRADDAPERAETVELDVNRGNWVEVATPEPGTAAGDFQIARSLQSDKDFGDAHRAIKRWIKTYGEDHELYPRISLLDAENRIARRDYYDAHVRLQEFLAGYSGTEYEDEALTQEFLIAEVFLSGTKRKVLGMRILNAEDIGLAILDDITANHPGTTIGELATMTKANYYYEKGDFVLAEFEYNDLNETYGRSRYTRRALLQGARSALASFSGTAFDDAPLIEADDRFRRYLTQYPGSAEQDGIGLILDDIQETRAAKELRIGDYYVRAGHPDAARFYFQSTIDNWPTSAAAIEAKERQQEIEGVTDDASHDGPAAPTRAADEPPLRDLKPEATRDDPAARE